MKKYTYFNKDSLSFRDDESNEVATPDFVKRSPKNYRFSHEENLLEKKCIECEVYYPVQKFDDDVFYDIHDEEVIHYFSEKSGYDYRCKSCNSLVSVNKATDTVDVNIDDIDFKIDEDNLQYIKDVAYIDSISETDALNQIIELIKRHNKVSIRYEKKII